MNKFAVPALAAAFALAACGDADAPATDETEITETTVVEPVATETVVAEPVEGEEGSSLTIDGGDVDATVNEDGVEAKIKID